MPLTIGQKSERVLRFLRGLSQPRVATTLAAHGFSQADWDEGWQLLQAATGRWLLREQAGKMADPTVIEELDTWENRWFPVAEATLRRRKPEVADKVFLNLTQTSGVEVAVSVSTFVQRLRQLEKDGGAAGPEALAILKTRGLTDDVLKEAELLLKKFGNVSFAPPTTLDPEEEQALRLKAEDELWAWYLEWSTIARNTITNGNLLRQLGFLSGPSGKEPDDADLPLPATTTQLATQPTPTR
jgi:hypothetical protein